MKRIISISALLPLYIATVLTLGIFLISINAYVFDIYQLTNNTSYDGYPSVYNGTIAWMGSDGNDAEIYYWDGTSIIQVTNNENNDFCPSLYKGTIAWCESDEDYNYINYWDGISVTQITTFGVCPINFS